MRDESLALDDVGRLLVKLGRHSDAVDVWREAVRKVNPNYKP